MALGKGLGSLIPNSQVAHSIVKSTVTPTTTSTTPVHSTPTEVLITSIEVNPHQPRHHFAAEDLETLVQSIKQHGIIQPLVVSKTSKGYQLIAGERRLRAARLAGLKTVPVAIRSATELQQLELAIIENIQRADLNPLEKSKAYKKLISDFGLSHDAAAKKLSISRSSFTNSVRLLDLPQNIQLALMNHEITEGHAKILLGLASEPEQLRIFKMIIEKKMSVRALEVLVQGATKQTHRRSSSKTVSLLPLHVQEYVDVLRRTLATKVQIQPKGDGGQLTIQYFSPEELSEIIYKITRRRP